MPGCQVFFDVIMKKIPHTICSLYLLKCDLADLQKPGTINPAFTNVQSLCFGCSKLGYPTI